VANNRAYFIPTDSAKARTTAEAHATNTHTSPPDPLTANVSCELYPDYPCFDSFSYALTGVIPAATGNLRPDWAIAASAPVMLTLGLPILRVLAWVLTALLLAGVTGLLRKT
jgi:hypothetical protein